MTISAATFSAKVIQDQPHCHQPHPWGSFAATSTAQMFDVEGDEVVGVQQGSSQRLRWRMVALVVQGGGFFHGRMDQFDCCSGSTSSRVELRVSTSWQAGGNTTPTVEVILQVTNWCTAVK